MKKMKKTVAFLLSLCLSVGTLVACGEDTASTTVGSTSAKEPAGTTATTQPGNDDPSYLFTVVYGDTNRPASGVQVQICQGEICMLPIASDADGKITYSLNSRDYGVYDVHILESSLPEGYTFDNTSVKTSADVRTYTLILQKSSQTPSSGVSDCAHNYVGDVCTKCGAMKTYTYTVKAKYDENIQDKDKAGKGIADVGVLITDGTKMIAQGVTDVNGIFSFDAPKYVNQTAGETVGYNVVISSGIPDGFRVSDGITFLGESYSCTVDFYQTVVQEPYTAFNPGKISIGSTVRCTLTEARFDDADSMFSTPHDDSLYYYFMRPSKPEDVGYYRLSILNAPDGVSLYIGHYASTSNYVTATPSESASGENPYIEFIVQEEYLKDSSGQWTFPNNWLFGIRAEGEVIYPVQFDLKLERVRDLIPGKDYPITEREKISMVSGAERADAVIGTSVGELTYVDTSSTLVKDSKGYYHVGSVDGPLAVVNLMGANRIFGDKETVSFLTVNSVSGVENLSVSYQLVRDGLNVIRVEYYYQMLVEYSTLCNADGVYPLNQQLYDFLKVWTNQRASELVKGELDEDHAFLLACSYYAK